MTAVYIHIPFCKQKCKYCDFNSYAGLNSLYGTYVDALVGEITSQAPLLHVKDVESIYVGGGTPTLLGQPYIGRVLSAVREHFSVVDDAEVSIEANPETVTGGKLALLREVGVNRLSIGFQSLDDDLLGLLGRKHSAKQAIGAFRAARDAGFENISIDLIFGIPGQSLANWAITLEQAVSLEPEHISCYGLTIEPGTPLEREIAAGKLQVPDEDLQADMFIYTMESLGESGFEHYEISNYAKPGRRCRHNLVYWEDGDYIGFGAGAHSKIGNKRFCNITKPGDYIKTAGTDARISEVTELSADDIVSEAIFLGLRTMDGIKMDDFQARFGRPLYNIYGPQIDKLLEEGLLEQTDSSLRLSQKGILLGNEVFSRFI